MASAGPSATERLQENLLQATAFGAQLTQLAATYEAQLADLRDTVGKLQGDLHVTSHAIEVDEISAGEEMTKTGSANHQSLAVRLVRTDNTTTSMGSPPAVALLPVWAGKDMQANPLMWLSSASFLSYQGPGKADHGRINAILSRLSLRPTSPFLLSWDLLSLLTIAYDTLTLPLVAFDFDELKFVNAMRVTTNCIWTIDIILSFFVGYHTPTGDIEMRFTHTASKYLRSWLVLDLFTLSSDWLFLYLESGSSDAVNIARVGKTFRVARILRLLRLVRVAKFMRVFERLAIFVDSEGLMTFLSILRWLSGLAVVTHFVACGWYAIGNLADEHNSWLWPLEEEGVDIVSLYTISFRWALAQYTPAPINIHPRNYHEQAYSLVVTFFGVAVFSTFMGSIVTAMTNLKSIASKRAMQSIMIRQFIHEQSIPIELASQILSVVKKSASKRSVLEVDRELTKRLPDTLALEMHYHIYKAHLTEHPLFLQLRTVHQHALVDICNEAMSQFDRDKEAEVFAYGKLATKMFFLHSGLLDYVYGSVTPATPGRGARPSKTKAEEVPEGTWLCEAALWCSWNHRGQLVAKRCCRIMELDSHAFQGVARRHPAALFFFRIYARYWSRWLSDSLEACYDVPMPRPRLEEAAAAACEHVLAARETMVGRTRPEDLDAREAPPRALAAPREGGSPREASGRSRDPSLLTPDTVLC